MDSYNKKNRGIASTVVIVTVITFAARLFGFLREILVAKYYGTTYYTDAYIIANNIPTVLFETVGAAVLTTFIPMYTKAQNEEGIERADQFTWCLLLILIYICLALTIIAEIFMKQFVLIFASGFEGEVLKLTILFSRILFPSIFAMTFLKIFTGYLHIYRRFVIASLATAVGNLSIIISLILANFFGNVMLFVYGSLICTFLQVLFLFPSVFELGLFNHIKEIKYGLKYVKDILPLLVPVFIGSAVHEINAVVDRTLVSGLEEGAVSTLNFAHKVTSLVISVVAMSIINITYPRFSEAFRKGDKKEYTNTLYRTFNMMMYIMVPICILLIIFRKEIIFVIFQRGSFGTESSTRTAVALACYAVGLVFTAVQQVEIRAFYSQQNTLYPMIIGAICTLFNIVLDVVFIKQFGYYGAALATSIAAMIGCISMTILLIKRKTFSADIVIRIIGKHIVSGIICALVTIFLANCLEFKAINIKTLFLTTLISIFAIVFYTTVEIILGNNDVKDIIHVFLSKTLRRK